MLHALHVYMLHSQLSLGYVASHSPSTEISWVAGGGLPVACQ